MLPGPLFEHEFKHKELETTFEQALHDLQIANQTAGKAKTISDLHRCGDLFIQIGNNDPIECPYQEGEDRLAWLKDQISPHIADEKKRSKYIEYIENYAHQGGFLFAGQNATATLMLKNGLFRGDDAAKNRSTFIIHPEGSLTYIEECTLPNKLVKINDSGDNFDIKSDKPMAIITTSSTINLDKNQDITHTLEKANVKAYHHVGMEIFSYLSPISRGYLQSMGELEQLYLDYNSTLLARLQQTSNQRQMDDKLRALAQKIKIKQNTMDTLLDPYQLPDVNPIVKHEAKKISEHLATRRTEFTKYSNYHHELHAQNRLKRIFTKRPNIANELSSKMPLDSIQENLNQCFTEVINYANRHFEPANSERVFGKTIQAAKAEQPQPDVSEIPPPSWAKINNATAGDFLGNFYPYPSVAGNRDQLVIDAVTQFIDDKSNEGAELRVLCNIVTKLNNLRIYLDKIRTSIKNYPKDHDNETIRLGIQLELFKQDLTDLNIIIDTHPNVEFNKWVKRLADAHNELLSQTPIEYQEYYNAQYSSAQPEITNLFSVTVPTRDLTHSQQSHLIAKPKKQLTNGNSQSPSPSTIDALNTAFVKRLKAAFPPNHWNVANTPTATTIASKAEPYKHMTFKSIDKTMEFSSSDNAKNEMVKATQIYEKLCEENDLDVKYDIKAADKEQALAFIKELKDANFDIQLIQSITLIDANYEGKTPEELTQSLIKKANKKMHP
jgi:hypothetical protein